MWVRHCPLDMAYCAMAEVEWRDGLLSTRREILRFSEEDFKALFSAPWVDESDVASPLNEEATSSMNGSSPPPPANSLLLIRLSHCRKMVFYTS